MSEDMIPVFDLETQYKAFKSTMEEAVVKVMSSGSYILGPELEAFEKEFSFFLKTNQVIGVNSGTDAMYIALKALGIGPGDEVITSPLSYIASVEAIAACGATPVFVDVKKEDCCINADLIPEKITDKTKAILPVHLYGFPCDMEKISTIASAYNLKVIEDAAQATGAYWDNNRIGTISDAGCFSFYPTKNLGAYGDAGAVTSTDPAVSDRMRWLRSHGCTNKIRGMHTELGLNSRMDELQATILRVKLLYLGRWNVKRRELARYYDSLLEELADISLFKAAPQATPVYCIYSILSARRNELQEKLMARGIETMVHYPVPLHLTEACRCYNYKEGDFPVAEEMSKNSLSLPMYPELTFGQVERITSEITQILTSG